MHTIDAYRPAGSPGTQAPHRTWQQPSVQGLIEWEDVPSLAHRLRRTLDALDAAHTARGAVWDATMPADLMPLEPETPAAPLRQVLDGLEMREVAGAELFRHFFGQH